VLKHARPRQAVVDACASLVRSGVMSSSGHGNFSCRVEPDHLLLTGAGMSTLPRAEDLALVRLDGVVEDGHVLESVAEIIGMHTTVYRMGEAVGAVVHTHSPGVTAFALAHHPLPCRYEALLRHGQADDVPVAPWAPRGSPALLEGITSTLAAHPATRALLLANHGLLAFGTTPGRAATLVVALEEAAQAELNAAALGGTKPFPPGALADVQATMRHSPGDGLGQGSRPQP
jgi:L-ribulose-5-phosphate 4-epimerase